MVIHRQIRNRHYKINNIIVVFFIHRILLKCAGILSLDKCSKEFFRFESVFNGKFLEIIGKNMIFSLNYGPHDFIADENHVIIYHKSIRANRAIVPALRHGTGGHGHPRHWVGTARHYANVAP